MNDAMFTPAPLSVSSRHKALVLAACRELIRSGKLGLATGDEDANLLILAELSDVEPDLCSEPGVDWKSVLAFAHRWRKALFAIFGEEE